MSARVLFRLVDVFANSPLSGNSAGVVLDADALNDAQMQAIAREVNASETAFLLRVNDLHQPAAIRWFTPSTEVSFCGHATLAAAHALGEAGCLPPDLDQRDQGVSLESAAGALTLFCERLGSDEEPGSVWWLRMPPADLQPDMSDTVHAFEHLGMSTADLAEGLPIMRTRDQDLIVMVRDWQCLVELAPDFQKLGHWCRQRGVRGISVSTLNTLNPATTVQSRFFAPAAGVNEDPVTGSVHGPLAVYLVVNQLLPIVEGRALATCIQGEPGGRTGLVRVLVEAVEGGFRTAISGQCFTSLSGEMVVPAASQG